MRVVPITDKQAVRAAGEKFLSLVFDPKDKPKLYKIYEFMATTMVAVFVDNNPTFRIILMNENKKLILDATHDISELDDEHGVQYIRWLWGKDYKGKDYTEATRVRHVVEWVFSQRRKEQADRFYRTEEYKRLNNRMLEVSKAQDDYRKAYFEAPEYIALDTEYRQLSQACSALFDKISEEIGCSE